MNVVDDLAPAELKQQADNRHFRVVDKVQVRVFGAGLPPDAQQAEPALPRLAGRRLRRQRLQVDTVDRRIWRAWRQQRDRVATARQGARYLEEDARIERIVHGGDEADYRHRRSGEGQRSQGPPRL